MGADKAFLPVGGREMLDRVLEVGRSVCPRLTLVVDEPSAHAEALARYGWAPVAPTDEPGESDDPASAGPQRFRRGDASLRLVTDRRPGSGPVAGVEAGLTASAAPLCFVAACDLPFLEAGVVRTILRELEARRSAAPDASAVVPVVAGRRQPLAAGYTQATAGPARRCVEAGDLRMDDLLGAIDVRTVSAGDLGFGDPQRWARSFTNVNRPGELRAARRRARPRVLCISGRSDSGKTTLIRDLLPRLDVPPDRIGIVKHTHHRIDWHPSGKDSGRLWSAGPGALCVTGPEQSAVFVREAEDDGVGRGGTGGDDDRATPEAALRPLVRACRRLPPQVRLVLAEGFRQAPAPKIWTAAEPPGSDPLPPAVRAVVTPAGLRAPWAEAHPDRAVHGRDEVAEIAARVAEWAVPVSELPVD